MTEIKGEKILIVGISGSGKSTFSKKLGKALNIEVHHLDKYFWKPGWKKTESAQWDDLLLKLMAKDSWIIEGNFARTFKMRSMHADKVIMFDYPSVKCIYRISKRILKSKLRIEKRTDMAEGCNEKWFDREFLYWVWHFNNNVRPKMYGALDEINFDKRNLIVFNKNKDVKKYLQNVKTV
ncbi:MAG: hypothetical protein ABI462_02745 [Ignavibacteria bacterium]